MTRRERLERKLEKRKEWAGKADARGDSRLNHADKLAHMLPLGQPILVGHHSEKRHRAHVNRIDSNMRKGCEEKDLAKHHSYKADGIEHQLKTTIFSDDENAVEELDAKIANLTEKRDKMTKINRLYRKGDAKGLEAMSVDLANLKTKIDQQETWLKAQPFQPYEMSNLSGRIRQAKERIKNIKARAAKTEQAEAAGGVVITESGEYCSVTFAEKPERAIINELKAAGFFWSSGSWHGKTSEIPPSVSYMADYGKRTCPDCGEPAGHQRTAKCIG